MNEKYKCLVLDDEPLALTLIKNYVEKTPELTLEGGYTNAYQALKRVEAGDIDILFLDIQMPGISGIEFARIIPKTTSVIFTTAFQQYAYEGFKVDAIDYLLKPIQYSDFKKAVLKAIKYITGTRATSENQFLTIRSNYQMIKINMRDILYIEAEKDYMKVVTNSAEYMTLVTMKQIEKDLPEGHFIKVHRSFIVNKSAITRVGKDSLIINNRVIPVSEARKQEVLDVINSKE